MKTIAVLLILLLGINNYKCQNVKDDYPFQNQQDNFESQSNSIVFSIDLSDPSTSKDLIQNTKNRKRLVAKNRETISFRLMNPNPFKYKYKLQKNFINFFAPDRTSAKRDDITSSSVNSTDPDKQIGKIETIEATNNVKSTISTISKKTIMLRGKKSKVEYNKEAISKANNEINILNNQLEINDENKVKTRIDLLSADTFSEDKKDKIQEQLNKIKLNLSISNSKKFTYTKDDVNNEEEAIEIVKIALNKLDGKVSNIDRELKSYIRELSTKETFNTKEYTEKIDSIQNQNETYLQYLANFENEAEQFKNDQHAKKIESIKEHNVSIAKQLDKLCDVNFENFLLPIDVNGENIDAVEVVLDRYTNEQTPRHIDSNKYTIWIQGGLKLDVSAGIFITSLVDNEYYTEKGDPEQNLYSIYKKDKGNFDFGFGSMINLTYRSGSWANPTFGVGAIFTAQQKFQIISGLGLVMGRKERLILHGGVSMGQVQSALGRFKVDGSETYDLGDNPLVPMENKFRFGYFFGFTYNITGFKINNKP